MTAAERMRYICPSALLQETYVTQGVSARGKGHRGRLFRVQRVGSGRKVVGTCGENCPMYRLLVFLALLASFTTSASSQLSKEKVASYLASQPGTLTAEPPGTSVDVMVLTPTFPVTFTRLEKVKATSEGAKDEWKIRPSIGRSRENIGRL